MSWVSDTETLGPGTRLGLGSGGEIRVGELLAQGGQGVVYAVASDPSVVLKAIKPEVLEADRYLQYKLEVTVANRPPGWQEGSGHVLLAWPLDLVFAGERFIGFTMPRIEAADCAELHVLANPSDRRDPAPGAPEWVRAFTWRYLVQTAANLAAATDALHGAGVVFGDFNERNIFVTENALVTMVDCDSMQIPNPAGGGFLCGVGRPEFTAPELFTLDLRANAREPSSDLFPLAIHIHQLLLEGAYPFDGLWYGPGEKPRRPALAAEGLSAYAGDPRLSPAPSSVGYGLLPPPVRELFHRAFVAGAKDPSARPSSREWREALRETSQHLTSCPLVEQHVYPDHHTSCPWCAREERLAVARLARLEPEWPLPEADSSQPDVPVSPTARPLGAARVVQKVRLPLPLRLIVAALIATGSIGFEVAPFVLFFNTIFSDSTTGNGLGTAIVVFIVCSLWAIFGVFLLGFAMSLAISLISY